MKYNTEVELMWMQRGKFICSIAEQQCEVILVRRYYCKQSVELAVILQGFSVPAAEKTPTDTKSLIAILMILIASVLVSYNRHQAYVFISPAKSVARYWMNTSVCCVCVCLFVCLSVRPYLPNYTRDLYRIFVYVAYGRGSEQ